MQIETTPALVASAYERIAGNLDVIRERLARPLTYAEKVLLGHLADVRAHLDRFEGAVGALEQNDSFDMLHLGVDKGLFEHALEHFAAYEHSLGDVASPAAAVA